MQSRMNRRKGSGRVLWDLLENRQLMSATGSLAFTGEVYPAPQKPVEVTVFDSSENVETSYSGPVTLAWSGYSTVQNEAAPTPGTSTVSAVNGVATFSDVSLVQQANYTLTATDGQGDQSASAVVTTQASVSERSQIVVVQQPKLDPATGTFSVVVGVEDALGNLVPNDATIGEALPAWISIQSGPDGALLFGTSVQYGIQKNGVSLSSQIGMLNPDGTMTFSGLKVSTAGTYAFSIDDATPVASVVTVSITLPASAEPQVPTPPAPGSVVLTNTPVVLAPPAVDPNLSPIGVIPAPVVATPTQQTASVSLTKNQELALLKQERKQAIAEAHAVKLAKIASLRQLRIQKILAVRAAKLAAIAARKLAAEDKLT